MPPGAEFPGASLLRTFGSLDDTEVQCKVTDFYSPPHDRGIAWDDPELVITWPVTAEIAIASERDRKLPRLAEQPDLFEYAV